MTAVRPTGADAYTAPVRLETLPVDRVASGARLTRDRVEHAEVCVIGTGAGGAVVAKELAEGGLSVAILEEGEWIGPDQFTARPRDMIETLYRDAGQTVTVGRPPMVIPIGRAVGGTTVGNSGTCFRAPEGALRMWEEGFGLAGWGSDGLDPHFRRVERHLNVSQVPAGLAGGNAAAVRRGAEALGWAGGYLFRNARGCVGSGVCGFGCPSGAKQHVGVSYVPAALAAGATLHTGVRARRIVPLGHGGFDVVGEAASGFRVTVRARRVIVACGTLLTPGLLRASGVRSPALGRHLTVHPATAVRALMPDEVDMWSGVPQSYYVDEFLADGLVFETQCGPPDYLSPLLPGIGAPHRALMAEYRRYSQCAVVVAETSRGRVLRGAGRRPVIRYDLNDFDVEQFYFGLELLCRLYWAAGAQEIHLPVAGLPALRSGDSGPLVRAARQASSLELFAFHPLGTARAGRDERDSVVDGGLQVHRHPGLHVADGSVLPSPTLANPQVTIMAVASKLAFELLGADPPADEPEPEALARLDAYRPPQPDPA